VVHSTAFRRLMYKTQVFINHEGDLFRTRLTHSLEVAQLSRSVARMLRLNEDLVEAIALAHDLGHTPFGHAGQDALHACMVGHGGFEHNLQSLRVVDRLEQRYPAFDGLNLSFETREGILKHCSGARPGAGERRARRRGPRVSSTARSPAWRPRWSTWPTRSPTTPTTSTTACAPACSTPASWPSWPAYGRIRHAVLADPDLATRGTPAAVRGAAPHVVGPGARTRRCSTAAGPDAKRAADADAVRRLPALASLPADAGPSSRAQALPVRALYRHPQVVQTTDGGAAGGARPVRRLCGGPGEMPADFQAARPATARWPTTSPA
jgi:dGTPase